MPEPKDLELARLQRESFSALCRVMQISRVRYAAWRKRLQCEGSQAEQELLIRIREAHRQSKGTYGSPRTHQERH